MSTGGPSDTLDPNAAVSTVDAARADNLFDHLTTLRIDGTTQFELAESFEPNSDATLWTIKLRQGVVWHDGSPFTADDVIYTLRRIGAPKSTLAGVSTVAVMDLPSLKKVDPYTLQIPLTVPIADLAPSFSIFYMAIVKDGTNHSRTPSGPGRSSSSPGKPVSRARSSATRTTGWTRCRMSTSSSSPPSPTTPPG